MYHVQTPKDITYLYTVQLPNSLSKIIYISVVSSTRGILPGVLPGASAAPHLPVQLHGHGNQKIRQENNHMFMIIFYRVG